MFRPQNYFQTLTLLGIRAVLTLFQQPIHPNEYFQSLVGFKPKKQRFYSHKPDPMSIFRP